jgi:1-acyl-sn-glycerol-3-phosphate acyltransferase
MIRTLFAAIVLVVLTVVVATLLLLLGIFYASRRLVALSGIIWSWAVLAGCGVKLRIAGRENIDPLCPRVYIGNHQSAVDIPILMLALRGDVRFLAKKSLFQIPLFGWVIGRYGHVRIDRSNPRVAAEALERALARFRNKPTSIAIFPEGTRSLDGELLPFRRGSMKIAQRTGLPVVPFSIDGSLAVKSPRRWLVKGGPVRLTFGMPVGADAIALMTSAELEQTLHAAVAEQLSAGITSGAGETPSYERVGVS